jgi:hypothetical protein
MKASDMDAMKAAWKNERSFEDPKLTKAEIEVFLKGKSKDISLLFKKGLIFDIILKSLVGLSFLGILILFRTNLPVLLTVAFLIMGTLWAIIYQQRMIGRIPKTKGTGSGIKFTLEKKISFYYRHFVRSLYVGALSNSLLVLSGMLYYFYFKYGEIRPFQWDDYLVFTLVIVLSYIIGVIVQVKQYNFHVKQLESCLQDLDADSLNKLTIREQVYKKRRLTFVFLLALICGLLVLAFFIFR